MSQISEASKVSDTKGVLPDYVTFDPTTQSTPNPILKKIAKKFTFPLSSQDFEDIKLLEAKFHEEENISGLAAPQIGISKAAIIFAAPDNPQIKKWRPDLTQTMEKQIWLNPFYEGIKEFGMHEDFEACFSVEKLAGLVNRFKKIRYYAFDIEGREIVGTAEGFLARIIQHEIDHLNGILFIEIARPDSIKPIEEYRKERKNALDQNS
jgi:peptide deformylase